MLFAFLLSGCSDDRDFTTSVEYATLALPENPMATDDNLALDFLHEQLDEIEDPRVRQAISERINSIYDRREKWEVFVNSVQEMDRVFLRSGGSPTHPTQYFVILRDDSEIGRYWLAGGDGLILCLDPTYLELNQQNKPEGGNGEKPSGEERAP